jgi:hypothetical protein
MPVLRKWGCPPIGTSNGKKRYACNNPPCSQKTFYAEYRYNGCKPDVKKAVINSLALKGGECCFPVVVRLRGSYLNYALKGAV